MGEVLLSVNDENLTDGLFLNASRKAFCTCSRIDGLTASDSVCCCC